MLDTACGATIFEADGCNAGGYGIHCRWCVAAAVSTEPSALSSYSYDGDGAVSLPVCPPVIDTIQTQLQHATSVVQSTLNGSTVGAAVVGADSDLAFTTRFVLAANLSGERDAVNALGTLLVNASRMHCAPASRAVSVKSTR